MLMFWMKVLHEFNVRPIIPTLCMYYYIKATLMYIISILFRDFRHDNIVAFRGMDILETEIPEFELKASSPFIVMEFISNNLYKYVESQRTPENSGLPIGLVWNLGRQVANGLFLST